MSAAALTRIQRAVERQSRLSGNRGILALLAVLTTFLLTSCSEAVPTFLNPSSPNAAWERGFWWLLLGIATLVFLEVLAVMGYGLWRRPSDRELAEQHEFGTPLLWIGGILIPIAVLGTVLGLSVTGMLTVSDPPAPSTTIQVIGHQWWWEVRYPSDNIVTANEIHIPTGQQVRIELTSADVIHDFWVPQLQGKIDAIPGQTNTISLESSKPGTFRGECLVYCGLQHANMNFLVVAQASADYTAWVSQQSTTPSMPEDATLLRGRQVFLSSACVYCHTIDGTGATGTAGPNLTHIGSRQQLAAGTLPNTAGALGGWLVDPQDVKPGNRMPPENLNGQDLQPLITYLESLK